MKYVYFFHFVTAFFLMLSFFSLSSIQVKLNDLREKIDRSTKIDVEAKN